MSACTSEYKLFLLLFNYSKTKQSMELPCMLNGFKMSLFDFKINHTFSFVTDNAIDLSVLFLIYPMVNRGSNISAYVLLNLLNEFGKNDKMQGLPKRPIQRVQTQIRLLLNKQSDLGLPCLLL